MATNAALERQFTRPNIDRPQGPDDGSAASILVGMQKRSETNGLTPISAGQEIREVFGSLFGSAWNDFCTQATRKPEEFTPPSTENPSAPQTPAREEVYTTEEKIVEYTGLLEGTFVSSTIRFPVMHRNSYAEQRARELPYDHDFDWPPQQIVRAEMVAHTRSTIDGTLQDFGAKFEEAYSQAQRILAAMNSHNVTINLFSQWQEAIIKMRAMAIGGLYLSGGWVKGEGNHTEPFIDKGIAREYEEAHRHFEDLQQQLTDLEQRYREDHPSSRFLFGAHPETTLTANPAHLRGPIDPERAISPLSLVSNAAPRSTDNPRQITLYSNWHGENNLPEQPRKPKPNFFRRGQIPKSLNNLWRYLTTPTDPKRIDS